MTLFPPEPSQSRTPLPTPFSPPPALSPCQPAPQHSATRRLFPHPGQACTQPTLSYLPTEGPPCWGPAHLSAPRSPRTPVPSGCVNTRRPPLHGIRAPPVPRVGPARAVPRHPSLPSGDPGVEGRRTLAGPAPSGLSSGHPAMDTAGLTQPPGHVLTQRARLTRFSAKQKRQALLFSPTIHCSSLWLKNSHTF